MKIAYIGGSWSSNIGNSFYNLGTEAIFNQIKGCESFFVPDPPHWKEQTENDFDLIAHLDVDLVVLTGPCLNFRLTKFFKNTFASLKERGVKIGFLSAGMSIYEEEEAIAVSEFLKEFSVSFIFTRDSNVIELLKPKMPNTLFYDGLCASMFLNDAVSVPNLINKNNYYVYNFDLLDEPNLELKNNQAIIKKDKKGFFGKPKKIIDVKIDDLPIIRTNNNEIGLGYDEIYRRKETYHSDLPYGYLSILGDARAVFSERVHTCAATLILGGAAQYIHQSSRSFEKRSNIFKRIGVPNIFNEISQLDFNYLNQEKRDMVEYLENTLQKI